MVKNFATNKQTGALGENIAKKFLEDKGFKILETNYHYSKYSEIDIIAEKNNVLHFVEVKTRTQKNFGEPIEAVNAKKLNSIYTCAMFYLKNCKKKFNKFQIDVVGILISKDKEAEILFLEDVSL